MADKIVAYAEVRNHRVAAFVVLSPAGGSVGGVAVDLVVFGSAHATFGGIKWYVHCVVGVTLGEASATVLP